MNSALGAVQLAITKDANIRAKFDASETGAKPKRKDETIDKELQSIIRSCTNTTVDLSHLTVENLTLKEPGKRSGQFSASYFNKDEYRKR